MSGGLPVEIVQRVVRQNFGRFRLCYEGGLRTNPALAGRASVSFAISASGEAASVKDSGSDLPDKTVVECIVRNFKNLSFPQPEGNAKVNVVASIVFSPGGVTNLPSNFVLTRLHARYTKDALGDDLVFKTASPIVGGREARSEKGALETGAVEAALSSFQARYAIRHEWQGAIACKEPRRGVWGGPWPDAGAADHAPLAAQKLAYAPRGKVTLASFVPKGVPELGGAPEVAVSADAGDAGTGAAASPARASRCGCHVIGSPATSTSSALASLALAMVALARRCRMRPKRLRRRASAH